MGKPDHFDGTREKLRPWLAQMDINMSAQSSRLGDEEDKTMLAISYLTGKAADWAQPYVKNRFHGGEKDSMFDKYQNFVDKITMVFGETDELREAERKLKRIRQTKSASMYAAEFRQI